MNCSVQQLVVFLVGHESTSYLYKYIHQCQSGYRVFTWGVKFRQKLGLLQGKYCILWIDIVLSQQKLGLLLENEMFVQYTKLNNLMYHPYSYSLSHTSQESFYKQTKSLEINIFQLKNDGENWPRIYFEINQAPSELLLPSAKKICPVGLNWPGRLACISEGARSISK